MRATILPIVGGLALATLSTSATAQEIPVVPVDANHVRIGNLIYDIHTGSSEEGITLRGPSTTAQELVRQVIAAGCLRPDEADLSRHDCYINHDGRLVHRPARDSKGGPKKLPLYAAMEPIVSASITMEHARIMAA
jgi:hypothetical protein